MHTEIRYGHTGSTDGENGLWIDLAVARVPTEHRAAVERILERARDALANLLGLAGD